MCNIDDDKRRAHEMHKQEAFQGMRAYHMSEIHHKQDAISVIKSTLTLVITINGAIIATLLAQKIHPLVAISGSLLVMLATIKFMSDLVDITNEKITKDHNRYEDYRNDYIYEMIELGLENKQSHWHREENRSSSGFSKTQEIINVFRCMVINVSILGVIFTGILSV